MNRTTAIVLAVTLASAIAPEACSVGQRTTAPSYTSPATANGSASQSPPGESKLSQALPTPLPSQPVANAAAPKGGPDSVLEIAPAELPQAFATPSSNESGASVAPDAGNAQDYANNQNAAAGPLPSYAGIDDYMNQEASYEAVGTGLPMTALLPPPAFYPYYYPYFYRNYYPLYVPPPIIISRPIAPVYAPHPLPPLSPRLPGGGGFHHGGRSR